RSGPTKDIWYYEHPLPEGRKTYTKTQPLQFDETSPLLKWWSNREETRRAWRVPAERIAANGYNLDLKNPHTNAGPTEEPLSVIAEALLQTEQRIVDVVREIQQLVE